MKSPVELNSLLPKFFCYITWLLYHLIRRDIGRLTNEVFTSNPIVSSKQLLSDLKITNCFHFRFHFVSKKVYIFVRKKYIDPLTLKRHNPFQN